MENFPDRISPMTLAAAMALGSGGGDTPSAKVYYPAGSVPFLGLPALSEDRIGAVYDVTDEFTSTEDFTDGGGKDYPAGTNVGIVNVGTEASPVLKYDCMMGDLSEILSVIPQTASSSNSLATQADVKNEEITITATASPISTANGKPRKLTIYGKSEIVDGAIKSAGEGGSIEIEMCQKNLFDPSIYSEYLQQDGTYKIVPSTLDSIRISLKKYIGKTLTFSAYLSRSGNYPTYMRVMATINGTPISGTTVNVEPYTRSTLTITPETEDDEIYISYGTRGDAEYMYFKDVQLEYGSTATAYEPYNGTMAAFTTGTPLRGIPDTTVRDVMTWDGSAGTVTENCDEVDLGTLTWSYNSQVNCFISSISNGKCQNNALGVCTKYKSVAITHPSELQNKQLSVGLQYTGSGICNVLVKDTDYTTVSDFVASLGDAELVYELATPTTQQLTSTENTSIAGLRTYEPQTHAQNNAGATMTVEAYANTANGQAISDMQPTRSPLLTLSASGWTNNAQTVTYEHDTGKRNTIDVEPANIKAWTAAGILATAETASTITFECDTVPTSDLSFRITSMEVR